MRGGLLGPEASCTRRRHRIVLAGRETRLLKRITLVTGEGNFDLVTLNYLQRRVVVAEKDNGDVKTLDCLAEEPGP